jgi:hypothetical protein
MLILLFRFKGTRKIVASRLMESQDFWTELEAFLPTLARYYSRHAISAVEIVSYQAGGFFYDPWPDGLKHAKAFQDNSNSFDPNTVTPNRDIEQYDNLPKQT